MPRSTIIIGTGISAVAYAATARREVLGNTHVLGGRDLWHSVGREHRMGQPQVLLTGSVLGGPREFRGYESPHASPRGFMEAGAFADLLSHHLRRNTSALLPSTCVTRIRRGDWGYEVYFSQNFWGPRFHFVGFTENVVVAMGAGPPRPLMAGDDGRLEVDVGGMDGRVVGGTEFMDPNWRMPGGEVMADRSVAVYGGSASAAWAVEQAAVRGMRVAVWFTRPGRGDEAWDPAARFRDAFPAGGRNEAVERAYADVRRVLQLRNVELARGETGPYVRLTFLDDRRQELVQPVDLLVYALGAEHTADRGIRAILSRELNDELVPYYDRNFAISSGQSLLAMGTPDRSLMVVGSAMSSAAGFPADRLTVGDPERRLQTVASYREISATLPASARPTEGIAMVMASIEALNEFIPARPRTGGRVRWYITPERVTATPSGPGQPSRGSRNPGAGLSTFHQIDFDWDINFNTVNRTQLAVYFAQKTDLHPFVATLAVALIVRLRGHPRHTFGLRGDQIRAIVAAAGESWNRTVRTFPDFEAQRLASDRTYGADRYLESCVDHLARDPEWLGYWRRVDVLS